VTSLSPTESTLRCPPLQTTNGSPMNFNNVPNLQYRGSHAELPNRQKSSLESSRMHTMDMEVTSNNGSSEQHSSSNHRTPSTTSNKSSSRTSYSPPQLDETPATQYLGNIASISSPNTSAFLDSSNTFRAYAPGSQYAMASMSGQETDGSFGVPPGWDFPSGQTGLTPDNRMQSPPSLQAGMNSLEEDGWANMLNDLGWDPLAGIPEPLTRDGESHSARPL